MRQRVIWVLVADGSHAKLFEYGGEGSGLTALPELMTQREPQRAQEIRVARPARTTYAEGGSGTYETVGSEATGGRETLLMKDTAELLDEKLRQGAFEQLVIAAEPTALGTIRTYLSKPLQQAVIAELPKNLSRMPTPEIERHLADVIPT